MKVLVTGARGFIGRHLGDHLHHLGYRVEFLDLVHATDIRDERLVRKFVEITKPDWIVHLAAKTGRILAVDPVETISVNAGGTAVVAKVAAEHGAKLAYASSSEVYGEAGAEIVTEDTPPGRDHNVYGISKRWGEEATRLYHPRPLVMRFTMPYGPGFKDTSMYPGFGKAAIINFLWSAMRGEEISVHEGSSRSWTYIDDLCSGVELLLRKDAAGTFNVGNDQELRPMVEVAEVACDTAQASRSLISVVRPPNNVTLVKNHSSVKLRGLGWAPYVSLEEGLKLTHEWLQQIS